MSDKREERREVKMDQMMTKRIELLTRHFGNAISRLENILVRLEARIEKFRVRGADVTESAMFAAGARVRLGEAKADLNAFVNASTTALTTLRTFHGEVRAHLKAIHESLMKSVRALKMGVDVRATSTATTTVQ